MWELIYATSKTNLNPTTGPRDYNFLTRNPSVTARAYRAFTNLVVSIIGRELYVHFPSHPA